jgi:prolyl oligopeptidase
MISATYSSMLEQLDRKKYPELDRWVEGENQRTLAEIQRYADLPQLKADLIVEAKLGALAPQFFVREKIYLKFIRTDEFPDGIFYIGETGQWDKHQKSFAVVDLKDFFGVSVQFAFVTFFESSLALFHFSVEGKDVSCVREFDLEKNCWKRDQPFDLPTSRGYAKYISATELIFNKALSEDDWTSVKSSRRLRRRTRGDEPETENVLIETTKDDLDIDYEIDSKSQQVLAIVSTTWSRKTFYFADQTMNFKKLDLPESWNYLGLMKGNLFLQVMDDVLGFSQGDVVMHDVISGKNSLVFHQENKTYLNNFIVTPDYVVFDVLADLSCEVWIYGMSENKLFEKAKLRYPNQSLSWNTAFGNHLIVHKVGYLEPAKTELWNLDKLNSAAEPEKIVLSNAKTSFDFQSFQAKRYETVSIDGVMIPYIVISKKEHSDQPRPCLLYGYGGFENTMLPNFLGLYGKAWLEKGGIYVIAHIRGGCEYGPDWHRAVLQQNRWKCYEDFASVAKNLVERGLTVPDQLAMRGGSNGGLLVAETARRYPNLFAAVICLKPVINMRKFSHWLSGKYWIDEYGNPDLPEHWDFMKKYCPYTQLDQSTNYPPIYLETLSTDDRVHPAHARQYAEKLKNLGFDYCFYESNEGGHMYRVTPEKLAKLEAQRFGYLFLKMNLK